MDRLVCTPKADSSPSIELASVDGLSVPLIVKAAQAGSESEVQRTIESGCNIDECHIQSGRNALLVAAHCGHRAVVDLLISNNAQLYAVDNSGATALHLAASRGHYSVTELLVCKSELIDITNSAGETPLLVAAYCGQIKAVEVLLRRNAKVNARSQNLMTVLHMAAQTGHANISQLLILHGADLEAKDGNMMTALHYACEMGHVEVIKLLLDCRAQIEAPGSVKKTPLIVAAGAGMIEAVEMLLKRRAAIRAADDAGMTALHWAAYNGHDEIVKALSQKKSPLSLGNNAGQTPLHLATLCSRFSVVDLLLRKRVPINIQCDRGLTALHYACDTNNFEIASLLLLAGANIEASTYKDRRRPIHIAAARNSSYLLDLLCDQKAMLNARDSLGDRPLCVASRHGQVDAVQKLVERGSPLYYRYENSIREDSPLCLAVKQGHFSVSSLLLKLGASALRKDETGWQPFRYAVYHGYLDILQMLLSHGSIPDIDASEIMAMPETIGFAPDSDISDGEKHQIQLVLEHAFQPLGPKKGTTERSSLSPTYKPSMTIDQKACHAHGKFHHGPHELPVESPVYWKNETPYQVVSQGQQVDPFLLPGYRAISQEQQAHVRAALNFQAHNYAREENPEYCCNVPRSLNQMARLHSTHDMLNESYTWQGPSMKSQTGKNSLESSTWPQLSAPYQINPYDKSPSLESRDYCSTVPRSIGQMSLLLPTNDIPSESHTWPGPRGRYQTGDDSLQSSTWPRVSAPDQTAVFIRPPTSNTEPPHKKNVAIPPSLADHRKLHERTIQATTPMLGKMSQIPRLKPLTRRNTNLPPTSTPDFELDSGSESDSSVYTAPETPIDADNYPNLNVRDGLYELE